jgi:hypothetical protein
MSAKHDVTQPALSGREPAPLPRAGSRAVMEQIAETWNADNAANGVERRWEAVEDGTTRWPWTLREVL